METGNTIGDIVVTHEGCSIAIRSIPYLPSFRRILARIIEPAAGASTWAFGSHMWVRYMGILIRKAVSRVMFM